MQNQEDKITKNLYTSMIDTLRLISFSSNEITEEIDEVIQSNLEELEGDYYTFLNPINIEKMYSKNLVTNKTKKALHYLFEIIHNLDLNKWNVNSFLSDKEWNEVRVLVDDVIKSIDLEKE